MAETNKPLAFPTEVEVIIGFARLCIAGIQVHRCYKIRRDAHVFGHCLNVLDEYLVVLQYVLDKISDKYANNYYVSISLVARRCSVIDALILSVIALSSVLAYTRGITREAASLFNIFIPATIAYPPTYFAVEIAQKPCNLTFFISVFAFVFVVAAWSIFLLGGRLNSIGSSVIFGLWDSLLGLIFGVLRGAILAVILLVAMRETTNSNHAFLNSRILSELGMLSVPSDISDFLVQYLQTSTTSPHVCFKQPMAVDSGSQFSNSVEEFDNTEINDLNGQNAVSGTEESDKEMGSFIGAVFSSTLGSLLAVSLLSIGGWLLYVLGRRRGNYTGSQQGVEIGFEKGKEAEREKYIASYTAAIEQFSDSIGSLINGTQNEFGVAELVASSQAIVSTRDSMRKQLSSVQELLNSDIDALKRALGAFTASKRGAKERADVDEIRIILATLQKKWPEKGSQIKLATRQLLTELGLSDLGASE